MKSRSIGMYLAVLAACMTAAVHAEDTELVVRARSHDGKFIGSAVGGLQVTVTDARTGRVLAAGMIEGGTGDTDRLMKQPAERGGRLADKSAARYAVELDIDEPTQVLVEVAGPLAAGQNAQRASRTVWLIPGRAIDGDGLIFDLHGLIVHPVSPTPNQVVPTGQSVAIEANVTMLCGCPITPGGLWDAANFDVKAIVRDGEGEVVREVPLEYAGRPSTFRGEYRPEETGPHKVEIVATQTNAANAGVGVTGLAVKPAPQAAVAR